MDLKLKSKLAALTTTSIWGVSFLFSKIALQYSTPFVLLAWRFLLAFVLMNLLRVILGIRFDFRGKPVKKLILLGLLEPVIYFICENYGVMYSTATFSGVMIALVPIASLIAGAIFLKEIPTPLQAVFSVMSVAGVLLMSISPGSNGLATPAGAILMTGAVISATAYMLLSRNISGAFTPFERTYCMFVMGFVFFFAAALLENIRTPAKMLEPFSHSGFVAAVLALGVFASVVAFFCQNFYVTYLTLPESVVFSNLVTVVSIITGILILHDPFTPLTIPSTLMIIAGVVGVQLSGRKAQEKSHSPNS